jgi:hypothetical protein
MRTIDWDARSTSRSESRSSVPSASCPSAYWTFERMLDSGF